MNEWSVEFVCEGELALETPWIILYFTPMCFDSELLADLDVIEQHIQRANDPKAALRQSALEKLTPEEREALGVEVVAITQANPSGPQ